MHELATGTLRTVHERVRHRLGGEREVTVAVSDRGGGTIRVPNAPWRFAGSDVGRARRAALPRRGQPRGAGELLGLDDAELDRLEARRARAGRAAEPALAMTLSFPVAADEGGDGLVAARRRRRRLGVRDQVGRLPHAGVRRRRRLGRCACRAAAGSTSPATYPELAGIWRDVNADRRRARRRDRGVRRRRATLASRRCNGTTRRSCSRRSTCCRSTSTTSSALPYEQRRELLTQVLEPGTQLDRAVVPRRWWCRAAGGHGRAGVWKA